MKIRALNAKISENAEEMLREIFFYTADHWGLAKARSYDDAFVLAFKKLSETPNIGHKHPDIQERYRVYPVGSHLIIYYVHMSTLQIVAILHQNMDIGERLNAAIQHLTLH